MYCNLIERKGLQDLVAWRKLMVKCINFQIPDTIIAGVGSTLTRDHFCSDCLTNRNRVSFYWKPLARGTLISSWST